MQRTTRQTARRFPLPSGYFFVPESIGNLNTRGHPTKMNEDINRGQLPEDWKNMMDFALKQSFMEKLRSFLASQKKANKTIYPPMDMLFNAFNLTPFDRVSVVILGQDPYHGPGQAHGLSFSVPKGTRPPPSLQNIFKELKSDLGIQRTRTDLSDWAQQGVLLLNSVLSVEAHKANSHSKRGWEQFTDAVIDALLRKRGQNLAFVLWGASAQRKGEQINADRHLVIRSAHPSPLSAERGFFGSRPFSRINAFLMAEGREPIHWGEAEQTSPPNEHPN